MQQNHPDRAEPLADCSAETETLDTATSDKRTTNKKHFRPRPGESIEDLSRRIRQAT